MEYRGCDQTKLALFPTLRQIAVCTLTPGVSKICLRLCLDIPSGCFPSGFLTRILYVFLIPSVHVTYPPHLVFRIFVRDVLHSKRNRERGKIKLKILAEFEYDLLNCAILQHIL